MRFTIYYFANFTSTSKIADQVKHHEETEVTLYFDDPYTKSRTVVDVER